MERSKPLITSILLLSASFASAHITLTFSAAGSSSVVNYTMTGSMTVDVSSVNSTSSGYSRLPVNEGGSWTSSSFNEIGNFLKDYNATLHEDLGLNGTSVEVSVSGSGVIGEWVTLDFDSNSGGDDDIRFYSVSSIGYPTVSFGDTVSFSGSGTFNLDTGDSTADTFGEVFNPGSYSKAINSSDDIIINVINVPEPSALLLCSLSTLALIRRLR